MDKLSLEAFFPKKLVVLAFLPWCSGKFHRGNLRREPYMDLIYAGIYQIGTYQLGEDKNVSEKYCSCNGFLSILQPSTGVTLINRLTLSTWSGGHKNQ